MASSKSSKKKGGRKDPGDSPITVGGGGGFDPKRSKLPPKLRKLLEGSVYICFNMNWYSPMPGDPDQHGNPDDEITMLTIYDGILSQPHPEADPTRTITIPCIAANGHVTEIKIKGKPLSVKFKHKDFEYKYLIGCWVSKVPRTIGPIEVSGKPDINHGPGAYVVVDNKLKLKRAKKR